MNRQATIQRKTGETDVMVNIILDGTGRARNSTGVGFLDHMLDLFAKHGLFDLTCTCKGDLEVDCHHTVEDVGITLGQAIAQAMGDKMGIVRYGTAFVPMDEALCQVSLDLSGRAYLVFDAWFKTPMVGDMDVQMVEEFFRAVAMQAGITLHIRMLTGGNTHHQIEAMFKAFGRAMDAALAKDPRVTGVPSTKGILI